uniref:UPAR/Ly6 domain-containing protein n=1 Tax=Sphaeramia orbicularis TaxID=375764 RepID=A0A673AEE4_9TELE
QCSICCFTSFYLLYPPGEALRCYCGGKASCSSSVVTCSPSDDRCGSVILTAVISYFKRCMSSYECSIMNQPPLSQAHCCGTDLCNR